MYSKVKIKIITFISAQLGDEWPSQVYETHKHSLRSTGKASDSLAEREGAIILAIILHACGTRVGIRC